jgi:hypothetical protein
MESALKKALRPDDGACTLVHWLLNQYNQPKSKISRLAPAIRERPGSGKEDAI